MDKIGSILKQKRLEKGMTIEEISLKTRLTIKHIKAIEEGDISYFKDDLSYLRFFLRAYCDALGIDFEPMKEELHDSIEDYTTSFSTEALIEHAQIEKGVQKTNEKMKQPDASKAKKAKRRKKRKYRRIDFSLLSFLAIIIVILIGLIFAFVMWFQGSQKPKDDISENKPPVAVAPTHTKDPEESTPPPVVVEPPVEEKEMTITKTSEDSSQVIYTIEHAKAEEELDFEITFGCDSSFRALVNDAELSNPPKQIYKYKTVLHVREKATVDKKIVLAFGYMQNNSVKVNGKQLELPAALVNKQGSAIVSFVVKGEQ
ncbi:MAG: helix-turn-helix domain-containing protein [Erysipelotrichaceae bacterium]|nr:helix-turn-helix domain-containing protein [Erysipelotrichaceae bacterium]MCI9312317.1 helix-turn-helix domain-containing protein [Erysipelotrichaceae bacterium]